MTPSPASTITTGFAMPPHQHPGVESEVACLCGLARRRLPASLRAKVSASDLVQETCLLAHERRGQFRGATPAERRGWLRAILASVLRGLRRRYVLSACRSVAAEVPLDVGVPANQPSPSSDAGRRELGDAIRAGLDRIPADERDVLLWRLADDLSFAEIGRRLGKSEQTAKRHFGRALVSLRLRLGQTS